MTDGLFRQPRRKAGACEGALNRTLTALAGVGILEGNDYAVDRAVLRDLARAVDMAREDAYTGDGSPWVLSQTSKALREAVTSYRPPGGDSDSIDQLIADISGAAVFDTPQP
jgi:hypothetical protein